MEFPSPTPRRVSRPRWLDLRLVLGIVLVLASVLIGARVVAGARHTEREDAAARSLAAGATLRADDVHLVDVQLPASGDAVYVGDVNAVVGKVLTSPLSAGELVPAAALGRRPDTTTVSLPLATDAAPALHRGQRVVVWLSTATCPSLILLPDVTVQDVTAADSGTFSGGGGQDVVLSVSRSLAQRVVTALAIDGAAIRAGVLDGTARTSTQALPSLRGCAAASSPP